MTSGADILRTIGRVAHALGTLRIPWAIGGSFASSVHGEPRATNDVDFVALLRAEHVAALLESFGTGFFAEPEAVHDAVRRRTSFNVIDEDTLVKVDVFVPDRGPLGQQQLVRRRQVEIAAGLTVYVLGPEDVVLQKLRWYAAGGQASERQWRDLTAVLRIGGEHLDRDYLRDAARDGGLAELLARALSAGG